jgi:gliding motility-associated-like protein
MRQLFTRLYFVILITLTINSSVNGQACFRIESILVDACATDEGQNEMVRFKVGPTALNTAQMNVAWATTTNAWSGVCQNASTANLVNNINATIVNCGFVREPVGGILPANSNVILITGLLFNPANNSFANLNDTVYVIFHCGSSLTGNFANFGSGIRNFSLSFSAPAACTQTVSYNRALLTGGDGALVNYDATGTATYDNNGCSAPVVIYDPAWTPPAPICAGSGTINLNTLVTGDPGGTWDGPGVTGNTFDPSGLSGDIDITYQFGAISCQQAVSETNTIQIISSGTSTWTAPASICSGEAALNLTPLITGTSGGTWSGTGVTGSSFNPSGLTGAINITYTVGTGSCQSTTTNSIQVTNTSNAAWTVPAAMCSSDPSINLNPLITGNTGGTWTGTGVTGSTFNPNGLNGNINVTYTVGSGTCSSSITQAIAVGLSATSTWTEPASVCASDPAINLNPTITGTVGGTWSGTGVTGNTFNPTGLNGNINVTYTAGTGACASSTTHVISVISAANPAWSVISICSSTGSLNLNSLITGTTGGTWSGNGVNGNSFNPTGLNGQVAITYSVGSGSCAQNSTQSITVIASPNAPTVTGNDTYCDNEAISPLTASGEPGAIFSWSISSAPEIEVFSGAVYQPTATVSTDYQVTQTINTCKSDASHFALTVNNRPAMPSLPNSLTICNGIPAQILTVESNANVFWFSTEAGSASIATGLSLNPDDFNYSNYSAIAVMNGCSSAVATTVIELGEGISANILGNNVRNICFPKAVTLVSGDGSNNLWSTGATSTSITVTKPGVYTLQRGNDCAVAKDTVELIDVGVSAEFTLQYPKIGFFPLSAELVSISVNSDNCNFYLNGLPIETDLNDDIYLSQDTTYIVQQICNNHFGCRDTVTQNIIIQSPTELYVPNAFTPNGDFTNDFFSAKGYQIVSLQIIIFNRWGEEVYAIQDVEGSWDGNTKAGSLAPEGVYTYKLKAIDIRQKSIEFSGSLMLMR